VTVAASAALVGMVARTLRHEEAPSVTRRSDALKGAAVRLADDDIAAYAQVGAGPGYEGMQDAVEVPLAIARVAVEVGDLGAWAAGAASRAVRPDAVVGVMLAEAAVRALRELIVTNVQTADLDTAAIEEVDTCATQLAARLREVGR
jgi:Formiminotransferase-cyclodeaminase